jgi:uncharacterized membrane-anchored protein
VQVKNIPTITPRYWTAILVASMAGANMGDFFSRNLHLGHTRGLLPLAAIFVVILWAENRAKIATEAYYWLAIIVVRTAATNLADLATQDLRLGYALIETGLAGLLIVIVIFDRARARLASVAPSTVRRNLPATDAPYWAAMLVAGTLGTASGDFTAGTLGLGLGLGSIVLAAIFAFVLLASVRIGRMTKPWYWASIVAARSAGTTMGDFVANQHGLHLGLSLSTVCTCGLLVAIVLLWSNEPRAAVPQPGKLLPARSREKIHRAAQAASQRGE